VIVSQHNWIVVGPRYHAAVELRTGNARARREARRDPSEEHHHTADYDYPDEREKTENYYDVIEGDTRFARTI
jgi:hypothetical protein